MMESKQLMELAQKARENAYAPYSKFKVGAALLTKGGKVYLGCNIENAAYSTSSCAERTAFFKAISEGERQFEAIAIVGGKTELNAICAPCGACRQVMAEFCDKEFLLLLGTPDRFKAYRLQEILPLAFLPNDIE